MSDAPVAAIDVGTNTTLLLVAQPGTERGPDGVRVLVDRAEITRLGRGIGGDGRLGPEGVSRTLEALREYATIARQHGARIAAVGTEALRRAPNAEDFLRPAREILGVNVEVIDGEREAALTFLAAVESFPGEAAGVITVVDIGGGSTEIVVAEARHVLFRCSLPIGSVKLTERHLKHDPPRDTELGGLAEAVAGALLEVPFRTDGVLIGVAGTVTSLAAMALSLTTYDAARVHGFHLTRTALGAEIARLRRCPQAERERIVGLDPRRADVILAGACILAEIARRAGVRDVVVSDRGIRWGLLREILGGGGPA